MKRAVFVGLIFLGAIAIAWRLASSRRGVALTPAADGDHASAANNPPASTPTPVAEPVVAPSGLPAGPTAAARMTYAQGWNAPQPPPLAAFRDWATEYLATPAGPARAAKETAGLALARARRPAMHALIESNPEAAFAATIPATVRAELPDSIVAELENRFSSRANFTVLAFDYDAAEIARRHASGLSMDPFQYTLELGGREVPAFVYGRRTGQTTKQGLPVHGLSLDGIVALHASALRVLEPGEPAAGAPAGGVSAELAGRVLDFASVDALLRDEARLEAAEAGLGPTLRPVPVAAIPAGDSPVSSTADFLVEASPATAWTVGAKSVLVIRVDFSDLTGDPRRGSTIYTPAYVQSLADTAIKPYYAQSSFGQTSITTTVSSQVYRMPQTATSYATAGANTQLHSDARTAAGANFDVNSYDRIVVLFSTLGGISGSQITYGGLAQVGAKNVWVNGYFDFRVVAHELGHTYGLRHANLWQVTDGNPVSATGTSTEYGDDFDTMGANFADDRRTDFNPWFKNLLGWAADSQVQTITTNGTYRLNRFDNTTGTGILGLKLTRDSTRNYWVGVRRNFTTNASMQHGAYVIWGYNSSTASDLLDTTTPGASDADAALATGATLLDTAGNISIRTVAEGGTAPNEYLDVQVTFGLNGLPVFSTQPQSQGYNPGANLTLTAIVTGTAPLSYQWRKNGNDIPGATSDTLVLNNAQAADAGSYTLRVSNTIGSVVSTPAVLAVFGGPRFLVEPGNVTAAAGQAVTITAVVAGSPPPTFQWRKGGVNIPNANSSSLFFSSVQASDAGSYDVVATNTSSVVSPPAVLTVNAAATPPSNDNFANAWTLTGNAGTALGSSSGATRETSEPTHLSGSGIAGTASVWFRWTPTTSGTAIIDTVGSLFDTVLAVYTGSTLSGLTRQGEDDQSGGLNTSRVKLSVTAGTTYYIAVGDFASTGLGGSVSLHYGVFVAPAITSQPASQVSSIGGTASFSVVASGTNPTYQWFRNGAALPGATDATLALSNLQTVDGGIYFVTISNPAGSVVSSAVTLTSVVAAPTINTQPANVTVTTGLPVTLTVAASGTGTLNYQWRRNGVPLTGATGTTLNLPAVSRADVDYYDVVVTSGLTSVVSQRARISVAPAAYPGLVSPDPGLELRPEASGGSVLASAPLADGRVYIGGTFVSLNGTRRTSIARVAADGTLDTTFTPPEIDNGVRVIVIQPDGKILIGGDFVRVNGFLRPRIARLNSDGSIDSSFDVGAGADATVGSLALQADGKVLVGGSFIGFAGTNRDFLVRLTSAGAVDTSFLTLGMSSTVNALAVQTDGKILVGGSFSTGYRDINGNTTTRSRLARLNADGTIDTSYDPAPNGTVNALALRFDGTVLVGGTFTAVGTTTVGNIVRLAPTGAVDPNFNSSVGIGFNSTVNALAIGPDARILVGGTFTAFAGTVANRFVRLNAGGSRDTSLLTQGFTSTVNTVAVLSNGQLAVGGGFSNYQNSAGTSTARTRLARLNADGTLDAAVNFTFRSFGTISTALPVPGGKTLVAGSFTTIRGATVPSALVQLNADATVDAAFNPGGAGANSNIFAALRQPDGKIVITGGFTTYNGTTANGIARLNADGTLDPSFTNSGGIGGAGFTLQLLPGGRIFVAGAFGSAGGLIRNSVAVFNADGTADATFDPGSGTTGQIYTAAVQADGKIIIGGSFTTFNAATTPFIARLNPNGALDSSFAIGTGPNSSVLCLGLQSDGKIVAGGVFSTFGGSTRLGLARLATTGALDTSYVPADVNSVYALLVQEDGRVVVRGSFVSVGNAHGTAFLGRLNNDASRDASFVAGGFASASGVPSFLAMDDAGRLFMPSSGAPGMSVSQSAALPTITTQPASLSVAAGSPFTLSVVAGSPLPVTYQWYFNGVAIAGASSSTLSIANTQAANNGVYLVVVANELDSVTSAPANVSVTGVAPSSLLALTISGEPAPDGPGFLQATSDFTMAGSAVALGGTVFDSTDTVLRNVLLTAGRQGLRTIIHSGTAVPGGGVYSAGGNLRVNTAGLSAFSAVLLNTPGGTNDDSGIFVGSETSLSQIARENQTEPGGPGVFDSFSTFAINATGQVAFGASLRNAGTPLISTNGVFIGSGGALARVARTYTPEPGGNGEFASVGLASGISDTGQVVVFASLRNTSGTFADDTAIYRGDGSSLVKIARENDLVPEGNGRLDGLNFTSLSRNNIVAFYTTLRENAGGFTDNEAIYRGTGGPLTKIARRGDLAPGGGQFDGFSNSIMVNTSGDVVFNSGLRNTPAGQGQGVFWGNGSEIRTIVRSGDTVPGGGSTFTDFISVAINDSRAVMFNASLSDGPDVRGLYIGDGTETISVARTGDALAGSTIVSVGSGAQTSVDFQQLIIQAQLANGKYGVFLFSPRLRWRQNGDGAWEDGTRWTVSLRPADYAQVEIDPATGGRVSGPANPATVRTLKLGGTTAGTAELNLQAGGALTIWEGLTVAAKGKLTGSSTIIGNVTNGGTVAPGNSVGLLAIDGNYTQTAAGSLPLQLGGTDPANYDRITATGSVQLGGTVTIELLNGFSVDTATFDVIHGQAIQLNSAQIVAPTGFTVSSAIVNDATGQVLRLTLVNDNAAAPTISDVSDQVINEDATTGALALAVGDSQTPAASLTLTGVSSNTSLVPNSSIVFGGSGANRTVTVTPAANQSGSTTITLTVSDGGRTSSDSFLLTVNPVNDPPSISDVPNQSILSGGNTGALAFTIGDVETVAGSLTVSGSSSNQALVPNANIVFGGSDASRTVTITPVAGQGGATTITLTVSDGALTASDTFVLTVNAAPTISDISNQTIDEDSSATALAFTVGDAETAAGSLSVTASSSNPAVVPNTGLVLGGSGANRTIAVSPAANASGSATITVTVSDGQLTASDSFVVTVNAVNDPPTISDIGTQAIDWNTSTGPVAFVVGDIDTPVDNLTVSASSSNQALVPDANIVLGGSGANRTITVTPLANHVGSATITVTVSDGALSNSDTFLLVVAPAGFSATHQLVGGYVAGGTVTVSNTFSFNQEISSLSWTVLLPPGFKFVSAENAGSPSVAPAVDDIDTLSWIWSSIPPSGSTFTYTLSVPANVSGVPALTAFVEATLTVNSEVVPFVAKPDPLLIVPALHDADTNGNDKIDVTELSRVITLYNTRFTTPDGKIRTGAYSVATTATVDGFAPDSARDPNTSVTLTRYHSADTNHNGRIDVTELSRVITLYNTRFTTPDGKIRTGFYKLAPGTQPDGFAPDPARAP